MLAVSALIGGVGTWLLAGALLYGRRSLVPASLTVGSRSIERFTPRAPGLATACFASGVAVGWLAFGGIPAAIAIGAFAARGPSSASRRAEARRLEIARSHWPQLIEELRILTGALGQSIPQALGTVGRRAPQELRDSFAAFEREWLLTTDLRRSLVVLKARLADPAADTICETLLVAHELGGTGLEQRLAGLADERDRDLQHRRDAEARQAGARFARRFVLIVPAGMALAGMSVGTGRDAYRTPGGQLAVLVAIAMIVGCWVWAGRIMQLPVPRRVLDR